MIYPAECVFCVSSSLVFLASSFAYEASKNTHKVTNKTKITFDDNENIFPLSFSIYVLTTLLK